MVEESLVNLAELGVLIVGVVIAIQQLGDIKRTREMELETRQAQLYMSLLDRWNNKEFSEEIPGIQNAIYGIRGLYGEI